jgi:acyl-CoA thioester hydrolase
MGRTELLRRNGFDYKGLEDRGCKLVVVRLECRYRAPAGYDDELTLTTMAGRADRVRLEHLYRLYRPADGKLIAEGRTQLVHVDEHGTLQPLPEFLRAPHHHC